jgi:hypothetical protein
VKVLRAKAQAVTHAGQPLVRVAPDAMLYAFLAASGLRISAGLNLRRRCRFGFRDRLFPAAEPALISDPIHLASRCQSPFSAWRLSMAGTKWFVRRDFAI